MLVRQVVVLHIVHIVANSNLCEELDEILQVDEKDTIFFVFTIDLFACLDCPLLGLVAPVTGPLFHTIGVPDLEQAFFAHVRLRDLFSSDQSISVAVLETLTPQLTLAYIFVSARESATSRRVTFLVCKD